MIIDSWWFTFNLFNYEHWGAKVDICRMWARKHFSHNRNCISRLLMYISSRSLPNYNHGEFRVRIWKWAKKSDTFENWNNLVWEMVESGIKSRENVLIVDRYQSNVEFIVLHGGWTSKISSNFHKLHESQFRHSKSDFGHNKDAMLWELQSNFSFIHFTTLTIKAHWNSCNELIYPIYFHQRLTGREKIELEMVAA